MSAYLCYSLFLTGFVYPVAAHAIWSANGYFSAGNPDAVIGFGMVDFAGSGVVHMTGGCTALYATCILGPRRGRFTYPDGTPRETPGLTKGHSVALQMLGTMILWFGWYGFNPGSALLLGVDDRAGVAATAAITTTLAAASGAISALFTNAWCIQQKEGEFILDIVMAMNGCLCGLVSITAGCAVVTYWAAILIGIVAGWVYMFGTSALVWLKIDDAVDAIPVHMFGGSWGVLATGLFAEPSLLLAAYGTNDHPGWFYKPTDGTLLLAQVVGMIFVLGWSLATMLPFFVVLNYLGWFRVHDLDELVGLDATYTGSKPNAFEEESDTDEEERYQAYQKRFEQKKKERKKKGIRSMDDIMDASWGEVNLDMSKHSTKVKPEQASKVSAPVERTSLVI
jgi:Amt family ammonium transporter